MMHDTKGSSALMEAAFFGLTDVVGWCLERGAPIDMVNANNDNALTLAARGCVLMKASAPHVLLLSGCKRSFSQHPRSATVTQNRSKAEIKLKTRARAQITTRTALLSSVHARRQTTRGRSDSSSGSLPKCARLFVSRPRESSLAAIQAGADLVHQQPQAERSRGGRSMRVRPGRRAPAQGQRRQQEGRARPQARQEGRRGARAARRRRPTRTSLRRRPRRTSSSRPRRRARARRGRREGAAEEEEAEQEEVGGQGGRRRRPRGRGRRRGREGPHEQRRLRGRRARCS